ncbi:hypothetical protein MUL_0133 [Mycobacterium ulcerans Agy99]|uniref:Uncharacterized protein n=1 Tax=Mycobacterium ulcerans (strain Agy99) TaxID=362242 RepID=A0PKM3_MYCUA|nr:hypothetical protein MUL_0133 [Mycobacterium ulcerans Agy99]OIN20277.1 hypothetical protein A3649_00505 [Mycobacterium ulcerans]
MVKVPVERKGRVRHSNAIDCSFCGDQATEQSHWLIPGETSAISLGRTIVDHTSAAWCGVTMTPAGTRHKTYADHCMPAP